MTASRIGPASKWVDRVDVGWVRCPTRSCGVGVNAARDSVDRGTSGGTRGVRMNAAHRGTVTTVATISATSDIGDNSGNSSTEEDEWNEG